MHTPQSLTASDLALTEYRLSVVRSWPDSVPYKAASIEAIESRLRTLKGEQSPSVPTIHPLPVRMAA